MPFPNFKQILLMCPHIQTDIVDAPSQYGWVIFIMSRCKPLVEC